MKSSKKIKLLQKDIMNAMNVINEINIERISENKTPSSGMVVFSFGSVEKIGSFGDMKDFKNIILRKAKECERFRNMLQIVHQELVQDDFENKCIKVYELDKPSPKKFPSGGEINSSKIVYDETTEIPKEFVMSSKERIEVRKKQFEEKNTMERTEEAVRGFFEKMNKMFKPKNEK